jgi:hypothetical protein
MAGITFHSTRQASRGSATGKAQRSWTAFPSPVGWWSCTESPRRGFSRQGWVPGNAARWRGWPRR